MINLSPICIAYIRDALQKCINTDLWANSVCDLVVNAYPDAPQTINDFFRLDENDNVGARVIPTNVADFIKENVDFRISDTGVLHILQNGVYVKDGSAKNSPLMRKIVNCVLQPEDRDRYLIDNVIDQLKTYAQPITEQDVPERQYEAPERAIDLVNADIPPVQFAVEGLIPEGLTFIAAPHKSCKSWMMLDLSAAVASGTPFLGQSTNKGKALYYNFENGRNIIKERLEILQKRMPIPEGMIIKTINAVEGDELRLIGSGFEKDLEEMILKENLRLVILDTFQYVATPLKRGENQYAVEYRDGVILNQLAMKYHVAIVAVTHTTKMAHPDDVFSNMSGSVGRAASSNCNIVIAKEKRTDTDAVLAISSRVAPDRTLKVEFDRENLTWVCHGEIDGEGWTEEKAQRNEYENSDIRAAVLKIASTINKPWTGKASEIRERAINLDAEIVSPPKKIGIFLWTYRAMFKTRDNVQLIAHDNGNAGKRWTICPMWKETVDEAAEAAAAYGDDDAGQSSPFN